MAVLKRIGGKIYKGLETTEENVWKANLGKAKYVLFSTHGFLAEEKRDDKTLAEEAYSGKGDIYLDNHELRL